MSRILGITMEADTDMLKEKKVNHSAHKNGVVTNKF